MWFLSEKLWIYEPNSIHVQYVFPVHSKYIDNVKKVKILFTDIARFIARYSTCLR